MYRSRRVACRLPIGMAVLSPRDGVKRRGRVQLCLWGRLAELSRWSRNVLLGTSTVETKNPEGIRSSLPMLVSWSQHDNIG